MPVETRTIAVDRDRPDPAAIAEAARVIRAGGLVAFATETVYGLGADATNPGAVAGIFLAKGRPSHNPLIVHVADEVMARACTAAWPEAAARLAAAFWPGPLTLVLPRSGLIPDIVTAGLETVGVRRPEPAVTLALLDAADRPIAAPSANPSGRISPTRAEHVAAHLTGAVDLILDSGPTTVGVESTVLDLTTREPRILRPGPIAAAMMEHHLEGLRVREAIELDATERPTSPGQLAEHYAPRTPAYRVDDPAALAEVAWGERPAALISIGVVDLPPLPAGVEVIRLDEPGAAARELYGVLHDLDARGLARIVVVPPPDLPEWRAVRDRLARAARPLDPGSA